LFIISTISSWALSVIDKTGYFGLGFLSLLESAGILIPSEVVLPFSGFLASTGRFVFWVVVLVATVGNLVGSIILFFIGKSGGRWILDRYGKYILISRHEIEVGDEWFKKHGVKAVFFGRILPIVRTFISLPAGIAKMNFGKFIIFTFIGALPWNFALALVGFKIGEKWDILGSYFKKADIIILVLAVIFIAWYLYRHFKTNNA